MKLSDIRSQLLEQHFANSADGLALTMLSEALVELGAPKELAEQEPSRLADVSKTLRRFVDGRVAVLSIIESEERVMFTAFRQGRDVYINDHTNKTGIIHADLNRVKSALKQSQSISDEVQFFIQVNQ